MWKYMNPEELYHYGILGMRWGHRKTRIAQNKPKKVRRKPSEDHVRTQQLKKKKLSQLSNKELKEYNERKNLERNYNSFKPKHLTIGIAAVGTAAGLLGNYKNIKKNAPVVFRDGKNLVTKMRNIRIPKLR